MSAIRPCIVAASVLFALGGMACGDGAKAVSVSAPIGINLKVKAGEVKASAFSTDKEINTETGNPYATFVAAARTKLGKDPGRIEVDKVTLSLGAGSKGVTVLEQALVGTQTVSFVMNDTNDIFAVAHVDNPKGVGPVNMTVDFDSANVLGANLPKFINGGFKVLLRGTAAAGFDAKTDGEADVQVTISFSAYE